MPLMRVIILNNINSFKNRLNALRKRKDLMTSLHNLIKVSETELSVISALVKKLDDEISFTNKLLSAARLEEQKSPTPKKKKSKSSGVFTVSGGLPSLGKRR